MVGALLLGGVELGAVELGEVELLVELAADCAGAKASAVADVEESPPPHPERIKHASASPQEIDVGLKLTPPHRAGADEPASIWRGVQARNPTSANLS